MTEKPRTFDIKFDSAGDFDKARELIERMNAALAEKDRRIAELVRERDDALKLMNDLASNQNEYAIEKLALVAQIDRVRALAEQWQTKSYDPSHFEERGCCHSYCVSDLLTALGEPAAMPKERP